MEDAKRPPNVAVILGTGAGGLRALTGEMEPTKVEDVVTREPDLRGHVGRAWRLDVGALQQLGGRTPDTDSGIASWVMEAPWAHPIWHSFILTLVHLRPLQGQPAELCRDGASHQFWVFALDPSEPRDGAVCGRSLPSLLWPANFAAQIVAPDDAAAITSMQAAVQDVCDGKLSPDTDYLRTWVARFGDSMIRK